MAITSKQAEEILSTLKYMLCNVSLNDSEAVKTAIQQMPAVQAAMVEAANKLNAESVQPVDVGKLVEASKSPEKFWSVIHGRSGR